MMEAAAAIIAGLKMPVVLTLYITAGYPHLGGGPAMYPMPSMAACESTAARIERDLRRKMPSPHVAMLVFTCQDVRQ